MTKWQKFLNNKTEDDVRELFLSCSSQADFIELMGYSRKSSIYKIINPMIETTNWEWLKRPPFHDITAQRFGRLLVLSKEEIPHSKNSMWKCKCDCGNETIVSYSHLIKGNTMSCGCYKKEISKTYLRQKSVAVGEKYGELTVLREDKEKEKQQRKLGDGHSYWECICSCGMRKTFSGSTLKRRKILSCGCKHSKGELLIQEALQNLKINFKTEYSFSDLPLLRFDFAIFEQEKIKALIEFQGEQHYQPVEVFGGESQFLRQQKNDQKKRDYCQEHGLLLIEIPYWELYDIAPNYLLSKINIKD